LGGVLSPMPTARWVSMGHRSPIAVCRPVGGDSATQEGAGSNLRGIRGIPAITIGQRPERESGSTRYWVVRTSSGVTSSSFGVLHRLLPYSVQPTEGRRRWIPNRLMVIGDDGIGPRWSRGSFGLPSSSTRAPVRAKCPLSMPAWGSITGTMSERLPALASGSDRSLRSVEPQTGIGARACQINGSRKLRTVPGSQVRPPRPDRTRTRVRSRPPNTQPSILTPRSAGDRVHTQRGTGVRCGSHYGHAFATLACGLDPVLLSGWSC
jgi:hypothetical protein